MGHAVTWMGHPRSHVARRNGVLGMSEQLCHGRVVERLGLAAHNPDGLHA